MKTTISITMDTDVLIGMQERTDNLSGTVGELCKAFIRQNPESKDMTENQRTKVENAKLRAEMAALQKELTEKQKKEEANEVVESHGVL